MKNIINDRRFRYNEFTFEPYIRLPEEKRSFNYITNHMYRDDNFNNLLNKDREYNYEEFYERSGSDADIFKCIENNKIYVPCSAGLFLWNENNMYGAAFKMETLINEIEEQLENLKILIDKYTYRDILNLKYRLDGKYKDFLINNLEDIDFNSIVEFYSIYEELKESLRNTMLGYLYTGNKS